MEGIDLIAGLGLVVIFAALIGLFMVLAQRKGPTNVPLRRIEALSSLPDTVGQAVETGKRLHISLGTGAVGQVDTAAVLVGLTVLNQVSEAAIVSDKPPIVTTTDATAMLLAQDTLQAVYQRQNAEERYDNNSARVVGLSPQAYGVAQTSLPKDEAVAGTVLFGPIGVEAALMAEAGQRANVTTLSGTDNLAAQAILYATTDHALIGEDTFAGGAMIGRAPAHVGSLQAQDVMRIILAGIILAGTVIKTLLTLTGGLP